MSKSPGRWRHLQTPPEVAALGDLLGRRWALHVVWELRSGPLTFRALQAACGHISPSVLQARLHEWLELGVIEKIPRLGYRLSAAGEQLYLQLEPLCDWAVVQDSLAKTNQKSLYK